MKGATASEVRVDGNWIAENVSGTVLIAPGDLAAGRSGAIESAAVLVAARLRAAHPHRHYVWWPNRPHLLGKFRPLRVPPLKTTGTALA
jgi:hypothetical protein